MTIEQFLLNAVRSLSPDKQRDLLDHVNRLLTEPSPRKPFKSIRGLWAGMGISLTADQIDVLRHQAWKNFPREDL